MKILLMRHTEANSDFGLEDHTRSLSEKGKQDALNLGRWLAAEDHCPTHALVSDSNRTRQSFTGLKLSCPVNFMPLLYLAKSQELATAVRGVETNCLLILAHNPGIAELANMISSTEPKHSRFLEYPPGSTAVICFDKVTEEFSVIDFVTPEALF